MGRAAKHDVRDARALLQGAVTADGPVAAARQPEEHAAGNKHRVSNRSDHARDAGSAVLGPAFGKHSAI
ncbi:MAG: hypothetical protein GY946_31905 [bacterium]|nr:hypothetical protein [bacterium]